MTRTRWIAWLALGLTCLYAAPVHGGTAPLLQPLIAAELAAGAVTGAHGTAMLAAVLGQKHDREWRGIKGRVPHISDNPGSTNLPMIAAIGDYASAVGQAEIAAARNLLLEGLRNDAQTVQFQEAGGYHGTWWLIRSALLWAARDDPELRAEVRAFVRRGALLGIAFGIGETYAPLGGRSDVVPLPIEEVCVGLLIGAEVDRRERWWRNPGNPGATLLAIWLSEHGRDSIFSSAERAALRSWLATGRAPVELWAELKLYEPAELRRYEDRLVSWAPLGVRSYERAKPRSLPNRSCVVKPKGADCLIRSPGGPVTLDGNRLAYEGGTFATLPDGEPVASLSWDGTAWTLIGGSTIAATKEWPLPRVSRDWLPRGEPAPEPEPTPQPEPDWGVLARQLNLSIDDLRAALDAVSRRDLEDLYRFLDGGDAGEPGLVQHIERARAAALGKLEPPN